MKYSVLALSLATLLMVGCSSKSDVVKVDTKPVKLQKLETVQATLQPLAAYNVSSKNKSDTLKLRVQSENGVDFVVDPKGQVTAYQAKQKLWQTQVAKKVNLTAGVEVADGIVVVASNKGEIFALDQKSGDIVWTAKVNSSIVTPSLILQNRVITIANDGTVYAHSVKNGKQMWAYKLPNGQFSLRGQAMPVSADGRSIAVGTTNGHVFIIDGISGVPLIQRRVAVSDGRSEVQRLIDIDGEPVLVGSLMVTTSYQGQLTVTDLNTQSILWTEKASSNKRAAVNQRQITVSTSDGTLNTYDLMTGQSLWSNSDLLRRKLSNPVILNDIIVVGDLDGFLHLIEPTTGKIIGREKTKGAVSHLYVDDNKLYVSTADGALTVWAR